MRSIPQAFQASLDSGATTLCWCWKIIRNDGVVLGFTEHDSDLYFDNLLWSAGVGLNPGIIESAIGFASNTGMATGALTQSGISADDIDRGKYDQAKIEIWRVDWQNTAQRVGIWSGEIGDITRKEHAFEAEITGQARKLNRTFGRVFSKQCDAELGDNHCTKDISSASFTFQANVSQILNVTQFSVASLNAPENDWFSAGTITWIDGQNAGQTARISQYFQSGAEDVFTLAALPVKPIAVGDAMSVAAGCNKSLDHCSGKFSNVLHFRGCPFMPGNDSLIAGPVPSR
ncbi:MAG: beta tubulin [Robiginitomaculum sp.]|nr:MAG: beta tubulin [Robiginitomaculum sp.]